MPKKPRRALTGRELRVAARKGLRVRYIEHPFDPTDYRLNEVAVMEKANVGYYVGPSDIDPDEYRDDELVEGETDTCTFGIYAVPGVDYSE